MLNIWSSGKIWSYCLVICYLIFGHPVFIYLVVRFRSNVSVSLFLLVILFLKYPNYQTILGKNVLNTEKGPVDKPVAPPVDSLNRMNYLKVLIKIINAISERWGFVPALIPVKLGDPVPSVTGVACCFRWVSRIRTYRDGTAVGNVTNVVCLRSRLGK